MMESNLSEFSNTSNLIISLLFGLILYAIWEWFLHSKAVHINASRKTKLPFYAIFSIGYYLSDYYKGDSEKDNRGKFIEICNFFNLLFSLVQLIISVVIAYAKPEWLIWLIGFNFWRFYSRSVEIIFAFGFDVFDENSKSGSYLDKFKRLKLAAISYFEIYLYSASFYMTIVSNHHVFKSLVMSLSVGTLTNVAYAEQELSNWQQLFPFIQVFATLSLVVLSLAVYVSGLKKDLK